MAARVEPETFGQKVTSAAFCATLAFCCAGLFPQRGRVVPNWPPHVFYALMAVAGPICGPIIAPAYQLPGLISAWPLASAVSPPFPSVAKTRHPVAPGRGGCGHEKVTRKGICCAASLLGTRWSTELS